MGKWKSNNNLWIFELNGGKQQWWGWDQVVTAPLWMHIYKLLVLIPPRVALVSKGRWEWVTTCQDFLFLCPSLIIRVSLCPSLTLARSALSLSLEAQRVQHNNPYKHLFLFMSLSSARRSSSHANVNTVIGVPRGGFHTCEQKAHPYLPGCSFVGVPDCRPRTRYCHLE